MPAATEEVTSTEGVCGYLNMRHKAGRKFRWKRIYAVLKQDAISLSDEKESIPDDTSELRLADVFNSCGAYSDKKAKKKHGFVLEPIDAENHDQWYFTCEDEEQQQQWMNAINDVISGKKVQKAVSCPEFDDIIVQTTSLQHLAKGRPKYHGRRLPAKRPRSEENILNGISEKTDKKNETPDSSQPTSPAKDLSSNGASTSAPSSPAARVTKDTSPAVKRRQKKSTFLKGIGARVSRIFAGGSHQPQTPRSPTSPARLDVEASYPHVPVVTTTSPDQKIVTKFDEEDEDIPDNVTKEEIIKMLDFVSETTEQVVYKAIGIRGTISSVDEFKAQKELQTSWRSLRKVVNALKTTMDSLTHVEDELKSAPEIKPDQPSDEGTSSIKPVPRASAPLAVDDEEDADASKDSGDPLDAKSEEPAEKTEADTDKPLVGLNDSLDNVEDFDERKASVSLMEAIQKTLNGHSSLVNKDSVSSVASGVIEESAEGKEDELAETKNDTAEGKENDTVQIKEESEQSKPEPTDEAIEETEPGDINKDKEQSAGKEQSAEKAETDQSVEKAETELSTEKVETEQNENKEDVEVLEAEAKEDKAEEETTLESEGGKEEKET